jgi:SAM-dependent methyltransferase
MYHNQIVDALFNNFIKKGNYQNVLDVGFGVGYSLDKFKELGIKVTGITMNEDERKAAFIVGHNVQIMDMANLDFEDKTFDLVWCRHAIEHSVMPIIALMEFKRVLQPGGVLFIEVPQDGSLHTDNPNHYSIFSDRCWQSLFRRLNFHLLVRDQSLVHFENWVDMYWQYWLRVKDEQ